MGSKKSKSKRNKKKRDEEDSEEDEDDDLVEKEPSSKEEPEKEKPKKEESVPYYKLFRYSTTLDRFCIFFGLIFTIITGLCQPYLLVLFSEITGKIVDYASQFYNQTVDETNKAVLDKELYKDVYDFSILTTILGLVTILCQYLAGVLFSYSGIRQIYKIRQLFLEKTLYQDIQWYDVNQTGDFATTFTENLSKVEEGICEKITILLFYETVFVVGVIWALVLGWKLALVCLISLPLSGIIMGLISWLSSKFSKQEMESYAAAGSIAEEVFTAIRTVISFGGQQKEIERYEKHLKDAEINNIRKSLFNGFSNACLWFFIYACYALSFWFGVGLIIEERKLPVHERVYTPGNMVAVFFNTIMASWSFGMGAPFFQVIGTACGAAAKIFKVLDSEPVINKSLKKGKKSKALQGEISFENVYFNYPSRPDVKVLRGLNLKIEAGQTVALVGSSGCGKSTCIQLLQRFYDPNSGEIYIDNTDLKDYNLSWFRNKIGVVGQEPALFATTISENIRYGKLNATQEEIERAAKRANVHNFIKNLPMGYDTVIGERGAQLSGGQKQRIAIARALVREPSILLLDEATSALDTTSEAEVQAALDAVAGDCTTIIVAHRLTTIRNANKIVVFSEGKVVEEGTHQELLEAKGTYHALVKSHAAADSENTTIETPIITNGIDANRKDSIVEIQKFEHRKSKVVVTRSSMSVLKKVIKMNQPEWFAIVVGCLSSVVTGSTLPVYSVVFGDIIGVMANQNDDEFRSESNKFCLYFLIIGIVAGVTYLTQLYSFGVAGEKLTLRVRSRMFSAMLQQEIGWYDKKEHGVGALCAKLSGDASSIQGASGMPVGTVLNSAATLILANTLAIYYDWKLALVLISFAPLIFLSIYLEQKILQGNSEQNEKMLENSANIAVESIGNIRTVVSLGCEKIFLKRYVDEMQAYLKTSKRQSHFRGLALGMAKSLMFFAYAAGMSYGVKLIVEEGLDYGLLFKVSECVIVGSWSIGNAFAFSPNFQKGLTAASRMFNLLERVPKIRNVTYPSSRPWKDGVVEYSRVYFSYPTRPTVPVLRGLDLNVLAGKTVALVGSSGCGKSTIIQLLERFYSPTCGEVTVDDVDIKIMDMQTLRSHLGLVSQEPNLFDRTIAENIAYGDNKRVVGMDEITESAKSANIHNFISSLPLGYDTRLGTKGAQLSGGQKQRIAIARALVSNPKVLLLDEATSALDNESEKIVQEALDNAKKGRTCITIAHRLSTIQDADLICVVQKGRIVEMGTHSQLLEKRQYYYEFYRLQADIN